MTAAVFLMNCPLCGGEGTPWAAVHECAIADCARCGHRYASLEPGDDHLQTVYDDAYFFGGGAGYADYLAERDILTDRGAWYANLLSGRMSAGRMLDVGAAAGFTMLAFQEAGWECMGVEPNKRVAEHAQSIGANVAYRTLADVPCDLRFDLVLMLQVVAHLADVDRDVAEISKRLKPGGWCLIETWDRASLLARMLGHRWHEYSPPSVLHWFSAASLDELLAGHGLSFVAGGRPRKRIQAAHVQSLLQHKATESRLPGFAATMAGLLPQSLPLPYPSWDLFWRLYQKEGVA